MSSLDRERREGTEVSLTKQILIALLLLLGLGAGLYWYQDRQSVDPRAEAAVRPQERAVSVTLAVAEVRRLQRRIEAVGTTRAQQSVDIVPTAGGRIVAIEFSPGDNVAAGQTLARLDDIAERADLAEAEAELEQARLAQERARRLTPNSTVAQATLDQLQAAYLSAEARRARAEKALEDRTVKAPFAGVVGLRQADVGAWVNDDTVLTTLDDLSTVEIDFAVSEIFYGSVRLGQHVKSTGAAFPDDAFEGEVRTIDSRIDPVGRAFRVRAVLPNHDRALPAGMFMHVELVLEERDALTIPEEAVIAAGDSQFVFTVDDGRARRRNIELGQRELGLVEIVAGLEQGDEVITAGMDRLRDGAAVQIVGRPDADRTPKNVRAGA